MGEQKCQHWCLKGSPGNERGSCFNTNFLELKYPIVIWNPEIIMANNQSLPFCTKEKIILNDKI